jgi:hypothetical protein
MVHYIYCKFKINQESVKTAELKKAICYGGSNIGPKLGFWRKNNFSSTFLKCINPVACLGISPPRYNPQGVCDNEYKGALCGDCLDGYSRNDKY